MRIGLLFVLLTSLFWGFSTQAIAQVPSTIRSVSSLPVTCNGGSATIPTDVVILISGGVGIPKYCSGGNTWANFISSGLGNPGLEHCTPDETGNSFYIPIALTNYFFGHWEFIFNTNTYINCMIYIPTSQVGATIVLDIEANDATAGHTANFQTCDQVINSGTINIGALTCAANQTFTTTTTAYNKVSLTFNVQSTLSNGSILVIKIATSTTGTPPTADMFVYPHFVL